VSTPLLYLCGYSVCSEIPLPELRPWQGPPANSPDITIQLGKVSDVIVASTAWPGVQVTPSGDCLISIPEVARLYISAGSRVCVELDPSADPVLLRNFLYGTVLATLCYQRGLFPLHGSCVLLGNAAVIFSGNSGAGKSTLAAALTNAGHTLLSDDVCALERTPEGRWNIRPAFPRVKLLPDALEHLQLPETAVTTHSLAGVKTYFSFDSVASFDQLSIPLTTIYSLTASSLQDMPSAMSIRGAARLAFLQSQAHRLLIGRLILDQTELFRLSTLLGKEVDIQQLLRPLDLNRMNETIALLEQRHSGTPVP
jgi:hypothetical protein